MIAESSSYTFSSSDSSRRRRYGGETSRPEVAPRNSSSLKFPHAEPFGERRKTGGESPEGRRRRDSLGISSPEKPSFYQGVERGARNYSSNVDDTGFSSPSGQLSSSSRSGVPRVHRGNELNFDSTYLDGLSTSSDSSLSSWSRYSSVERRTPGMATEARRSEWELVEPQLHAPLQERHIWCLLEYKWFLRWKQEAMLGKGSGFSSSMGPIDNSFMLSTSGELRKVYENVDYALVPASVWEQLHKRYGGGPEIRREVIRCGSGSTDLEVEVNLKKFNVFLKGSDPSADGITLQCSRQSTLREMKRKACVMLGVSELEDSKLYSFYGGRIGGEVSNLDDTIEKSMLMPDSTLMLTTRQHSPQPRRTLWCNDPLIQNGDENSSLQLTVSSSNSKARDRRRTGPLRDDEVFDGISFQQSNSLHSGNRSREIRPQVLKHSPRMTGDSTEFSGSYVPSSISGSGAASSTRRTLCADRAAGLTNQGNTCFMNAVFQCLGHARELTEYFLGEDYRNDIHHSSRQGITGEIATAYHRLLKEMWNGKNAVVSTADMKNRISAFYQQFSGNQQHDTQELLIFLLDGLHEELNRAKSGNQGNLKQLRGDFPDPVAAQHAWETHLYRNNSIVVDLFHGQLKSTVKCPACGYSNSTFDPFVFLSLPLARTSERQLNVVLVRPNVRAVIEGVVVSKGTRMEDVRKQFTTRLSVAAHELAFFEVENHQIRRCIASDTTVDAFSTREPVLYVYHLPKDMLPRSAFYIALGLRISATSRFSAAQAVGYPWMIPVTPTTTLSELQDLVQSRIGPFMLGSSDANRAYFLRLGTLGSNKAKEVDGMSTNVPLRLGDRDVIWVDWKIQSKLDMEFDSESAFAIEESLSTSSSTSYTGEVNLESCISRFTREEVLSPNDTWYCRKCHGNREASKKLDLWSLPDILVVHLKRFFAGRFGRERLNTFVDYPVNGLDMTRFVCGVTTKEQFVYDLFAVANHTGSLNSGHYTAICKNWRTSKWHLFDDSRVTESSTSSIKSRSNYLLFFARRHSSQGRETSSRSVGVTAVSVGLKTAAPPSRRILWG